MAQDLRTLRGIAPAAVGRDLAAAAVVALAAISFYVSAATLLFQGTLAPHLPVAIGAVLLGGAVLALYAALRGALPLVSVGPVPTTVPVLAAITAGVADRVSGPSLLPTALAALAVTGLAIGLAWWVAGRRRWGGLMRYVPYPVVGGFLASIGWLMLTGGLGVSTGQGLTLGQLLAWRHAGPDLRMLAGLLAGIVLWRVTRRFTHPFTLPVAIAVVAVVMHAGLAASGLSLDDARAAGWLLPAVHHTEPQPAWVPSTWAAVSWPAVVEQAPLIAAAVLVATLSLLLSDSSLEIAWNVDVDVDRDLRVLGQGNLVTVALGGLVGGVSISRSVLNRAAGAVTRASGALKGLLCLAAVVGGGPAIALVPRPLLGGLLIYLGLETLKTWLVDGRRRLPAGDHLIVVAMVGVTAGFGFLAAVCVGIAACCFSFAAASSRLSPLRRCIRRHQWPARAERSPGEEALLAREGGRLCILELQGVLFFGSTAQLAREVQPLWAGEDPPQRLLLDFRHVHGLDTSAAQSLARLVTSARRAGRQVAVSGLTPTLRRALTIAGVLASADAGEFADVDAAVLAWDDERLDRAGADRPAGDRLAGWGPPDQDPHAWLTAHFEPMALRPGEVLFEQGSAADALYVVRQGRLLIVARQGGSEVLLRTVHAGSAIGEMGLIRGQPRSATARAADEVRLFRLTRNRLDELARTRPEVHAELCRQLLVQMAGRIERLDRQAHALAR